jgi:putative transposase
MIRTIQVKLNPTIDQANQLGHWLDLSRSVYNACLEQRILAYKQSKIWPTKPGHLTTRYGQQNQLPDLKEAIPDFKDINAQVLQETVTRLDKTFQAFFRRNKVTKTGGFPRFKSSSRFNSFTHPQASTVKLSKDSRRFYLPSFGWIGYHKQGPNARSLAESALKTVTIKKLADGWWASFSAEVALPDPLSKTGKTVGIDLGLTNLVTLSTGEVLGSLKEIKLAEKKIRLTQRDLSRKTFGSHRRRDCKAKLGKQNLRLERTKDQQLHGISKKLVAENDVIVIEDLNIHGMITSTKPTVCNRKGLRRNIGLAKWGRLAFYVAYKAEEAGRLNPKVDPKGTSQECSGCGSIPKERKDLSIRTHRCPDCGLVLDRDLNAARNILQRGLKQINKGSIAPSRIPKDIQTVGTLEKRKVT